MSLTRTIANILRAVLLASTGCVIASIAAAQAPSCPPPTAIDQGRSLVVTDAALDKAKFSFVNTINAILKSLQIQETAENRENFVKSLLTSMNDRRYGESGKRLAYEGRYPCAGGRFRS
jgi:hypothetical protein